MDDMSVTIERAKEHFAKIVTEQLARVDAMKSSSGWTDHKKIKPVIVGICPGDGIGLEISVQARRVLDWIL